jgi:hypothetical protein
VIQKSHVATINLNGEILTKELTNIQTQNQRNEPLSPKKSQSNLLKHILANKRASQSSISSDSWASLPALEPKEEIEEEMEEEKSETIKKPDLKKTSDLILTTSFTDLTENYLLSESESDDEDSGDEDHPEILQFLHK